MEGNILLALNEVGQHLHGHRWLLGAFFVGNGGPSHRAGGSGRGLTTERTIGCHLWGCLGWGGNLRDLHMLLGDRCVHSSPWIVWVGADGDCSPAIFDGLQVAHLWLRNLANFCYVTRPFSSRQELLRGPNACACLIRSTSTKFSSASSQTGVN